MSKITITFDLEEAALAIEALEHRATILRRLKTEAADAKAKTVEELGNRFIYARDAQTSWKQKVTQKATGGKR